MIGQVQHWGRRMALPSKGGPASSTLRAALCGAVLLLALRAAQLAAHRGRLSWPGPGGDSQAPEQRREDPPVFPGGRGLFDLNVTCDSSRYPGMFYNNTCSPAFCSVAKDYTTPTCIVASTSYTFAQKVADVGSKQCRTCTPAADTRCSSAWLAAAFAGREGVYAAYCNDRYLVIHSDGNTGSVPNLDDIPTPPGGTMNSALCRTRMATYVGASPRVSVSKYLLCPTLLPTAAGTNNLAAFPDGAADSPYGYLISTGLGVVYGLPSGGAVGTTVAGQQIYPTFNNRASYTPENCEVDHCNQHVGQGGGYPHTHGDSFGPNCLYSAANYTSATAHPPLTGFSFDGILIYGRHLDSRNSGYSTPLDDCGGHSHSDFDGGRYHYHNQVLNLTTTGFGAMGVAAGQSYIATTVGPHKCWRANISADAAFWAAGPSSDTYIAPCCGSSHWYARGGVSINGAGTQSWATLSNDVCSTTTATTPTPSGTRSPTATSTLTGTTTPAGATTPTPSATGSPTPTPTGSSTTTLTITATSSGTPSNSATGSGTPTGTGSPTATTTLTGSATPTPTSSLSPGASPSGTPSATGSGTASASAIASLTSSTTASASPTPTGTPTATMSVSGTGTPGGSAAAATRSPSSSSSPMPTASPSLSPSATAATTSAGTLQVAVALRPAGAPAAAVSGGAALAARQAVSNATGVALSRVMVISATNDATGAFVDVAAGSAVNAVHRRRALAATTSDTLTLVVAIDVPFSPGMTAAQASTAASALAAAANAAAATGAYQQAAAAWAVSTNSTVQPVTVAQLAFAASPALQLDNSGGGSGGGPSIVIIGAAAAGGVVVIAVVAALAVYCCKRRRRAALASAQPSKSPANSPGMPPPGYGQGMPTVSFVNPASGMRHGSARSSV